MQALACPDCGHPVEDPGLCVRCWDRCAQRSDGPQHRLRVVDRRDRIRQRWRQGRSREAIAALEGVSLRTVDRYKPPEMKRR